MASYEAGSVTAKVILDTSEWNKAIENLKTEVGELKTSLNAIKGKNGLDEQVKKLKEDMSTLTETNKNYQKTIKDLRKTNSDLAKGTKTVSEALKTEQKTLDSTVKKTNEAVKANDKLTASLKKTEAQSKKTQSSAKRVKYTGMSNVRNSRYEKEYMADVINYGKWARSEGKKIDGGKHVLSKSATDYYMPVFSDFIDPLEPQNRKKYVKQTQARFEALLNELNVGLTKVKDKNLKSIRWYNPDGSSRLVNALDFSKMPMEGNVNDIVNRVHSKMQNLGKYMEIPAKTFGQSSKIIQSRAKKIVEAIDKETQAVNKSAKSFKQYSNNTTISNNNLKTAATALNTFEKELKDVEIQAKKTRNAVNIPTNEIGYAKNGIQGRHSISGVESFRDEKYESIGHSPSQMLLHPIAREGYKGIGR